MRAHFVPGELLFVEEAVNVMFCSSRNKNPLNRGNKYVFAGFVKLIITGPGRRYLWLMYCKGPKHKLACFTEIISMRKFQHNTSQSHFFSYHEPIHQDI